MRWGHIHNIALAVFGIAGGGVLAGLIGLNTDAARAQFWAGLFVGSVIILVLSASVAVLAAANDRPGRQGHSRPRSMIPLIGMVVSGLITLGFCVWYFWPSGSTDIVSPLPTNLKEDNRAELIQLNEYMSTNETERLSGQLNYNIEVQNKRLDFLKSNKGQQFPYFLYAKGGGVSVRIREDNWDGKYISIGAPIGKNGVDVSERPSDVSYFISRPEDVEDEKTMLRFLNSPLIPDSVMVPLKDYKSDMGKNGEILVDTLNEYMKKSPRYFLEARNPQSNFVNVVANSFIKRMIQPSVTQDRVKYAIRIALNGH